MTHPLKRELVHHEHFRRKLREQFPEETEESLADTLEGLTDLNEMLAKVMRSVQWDEAQAMGARAIISDLTARIARFEHRALKKRALVQETMELANLRKIEAPDMTLSLRKCPQKLIVTDEAQIPLEHFKVTRQLMKGHLKAILQEGTKVPGAELSNQPDTLSVRTK